MLFRQLIINDKKYTIVHYKEPYAIDLFNTIYTVPSNKELCAIISKCKTECPHNTSCIVEWFFTSEDLEKRLIKEGKNNENTTNR